MDISLNADNIRFFENEGRFYTTGERTFFVLDSTFTGQHGLVAPYGIKKFEDKNLLTVLLTPELKQAIETFETEFELKASKEIPNFLDGTQGFHSCIKTNNDNESYISLKINEKTSLETYDVKKKTFSKTPITSVPPGCKISFNCTINHPWTFTIDKKMKWGFAIKTDEVVIYNDGSLKRKTDYQPKKTIKQLILQGAKKKIKMIDASDL